jgi:hypothetical protein
MVPDDTGSEKGVLGGGVLDSDERTGDGWL